MANRWKGNIIAAAATTSSGTDFTGKANGAWGLNSQLQQKQGGLWSKGVYAPNAPTIGTVSAGDAEAFVPFTGSTDTGGGTITSYTATSTPSGITASSATSPITVTGLTNGTSYTFTVRANSSLGYISAESASSNSVTPEVALNLVVFATGSGVNTFAWSDSSGYGAYIASPTTTSYSSADFNSDNSFVALGAGTTPFVEIYPISKTAYGTKSANPSSLPAGSVNAVDYSTSNSYLALGHNTSPFVSVYSMSNAGSSFGSKVTNPATLPANYVKKAKFTPNGNAIALAHASSPFITAYPFTTGFGTKYANPSSSVGSMGNGLCFNPAGNVIAVAAESQPTMSVYPWSSSTGFGTRYADPAIIGSQYGGDILFTPSGNSIVYTGGGSAYQDNNLMIYPWDTSTGFGAKYANPVTLPTANISKNTINKLGTVIILGGGSNGQAAYAFVEGVGIGTKYAAPSSGPLYSVNSVRFTN